MKILLLPSCHALSHVSKCLAVRERLLEKGHAVELAVVAARSKFLEKLSIPHHVLPDLQEADGGPIPSFAWFKKPELFSKVVRAETKLIERVAPDRVVGVFRFTASVSSKIAGVPFDAINCGCMSHGFRGVLGFEDGEPGAAKQKEFLDYFYKRSAERVSLALASFGLPKIDDLRILLAGERTFLWDTPEFQPLDADASMTHVGPLDWSAWPVDPLVLERLNRIQDPLAVVSFGTASEPVPGLPRLLRRLLKLGFHVVVTAGGGMIPCQEEFQKEAVSFFRFAPLTALLDRASLLVCHGGQQSIFEALARAVPVAVLPLQPEQAQNGLCLERIGAGRRLVPSLAFWGTPHVCHEAFEHMGDQELDEQLRGLLENPTTKTALRSAQAWLGRYRGAESIAKRLTETTP